MAIVVKILSVLEIVTAILVIALVGLKLRSVLRNHAKRQKRQ